MKGVAAAILVALAVSCLVAKPSHALTCVDVDLCLTPCIAYLTGKQAAPAPACCQGVTKLKALAATTSDRQLACNCMKQAASRFQNIDDDAVINLPKKCGTPLPFPINKAVDCSKLDPITEVEHLQEINKVGEDFNVGVNERNKEDNRTSSLEESVYKPYGYC